MGARSAYELAAQPYILRTLYVTAGLDSLPPWEEPSYAMAAFLYAVHRQQYTDKEWKRLRFGKDQRQISLGASLRRLRGSLSAGEESLDRYFAALISARYEDLLPHLSRLLRRVATVDATIPVHYPQLVTQLLHWEDGETAYGRPSPQRTWTRDYWQRHPVDEAYFSSEPNV